MFTGIITHLGKLTKKENTVFSFETDQTFFTKLEIGTSVAVNGVCLTITSLSKNIFSVEIMPETVKKTVFELQKINDLVNLELPMTPTDFFSGHIVQGHVDGIGTIKQIKEDGNSTILTIQIPKELAKYIVAKGSICVNGISLTLIDSSTTNFSVGIIPFTRKHTMLLKIKVGDKVNIETDIIAKYIEKFIKI